MELLNALPQPQGALAEIPVTEWRATIRGAAGRCAGCAPPGLSCIPTGGPRFREAESSVRKLAPWQHVGGSQYERVDKFAVGQVDQAGGGEDCCCREAARRAPCWDCIASIAMLLVFFCGLYIAVAPWLLPWAPQPWKSWLSQWPHIMAAGRDHQNVTKQGGQKHFNCEVGYANWQTAWQVDQMDWCCRFHGKGCPPDAGYDCQAGLDNWEVGWNDSKKNFCCGYDREGCESVFASASNTSTKSATLPSGARINTSRIFTTTSSRYNCEHHLERWVTAWSPAKKYYCCKLYDFGCVETTTPVPYDCEANMSDWAKTWDDGKKAWCCRHEHFGCPATTAPPTVTITTSTTPTTTTATVTTATPGRISCEALCMFGDATASCRKRIQWVISHAVPTRVVGESEACQYAVGLVLGQCSVCAGCSLSEAGCQVPLPPGTESFDCQVDPSTSWSPAKKAWCCTQQGLDCPADVMPGSFECKSDMAGWGQAKKDWCCTYERVACTSSTAEQRIFQ